jgi:ribosomal protein L37AE/L43A
LASASRQANFPSVPAEIAAPQFTVEILLYGIAVLGLFGALWFFSERRDRARFVGRRTVSFHCIRCDHLYVQPTGTETAPCPRCGHGNTRLKF